jgi:hypothetical protein
MFLKDQFKIWKYDEETYNNLLLKLPENERE